MNSLCMLFQPSRDTKKDKIVEKFVNFLKDQSGAAAVEYGILVALIAMVIIGTVRGVGTDLNATFSNLAAQLPT
ncbi:MAG: Flp family type IVb pilin [Desulfobaccales bacterium]